VRQEIVGKQISYSLSLWERARVRIIRFIDSSL